jgi:predicted ATPase
MRRDLPSGTVTFLFTDVEGSTRLLHELGQEAYASELARHRAIIRNACAAEGGVEVDTQGDAFFFAFPDAAGALAAASALTDGLSGGPIQVRSGLHTGTPLVTSEGYVGDDVHFAARVASSGHGGQVLVSAATAELVERTLTSLGSHRLKDIPEPVSLFQLGESAFPPLKTIANTNLPTPASTFLGREAELYEADTLLRETRLLTIHGPGGQGKTRLAVELAHRAREERFSDYADGVFSCFFASLRDPTLVLSTIAETLSANGGSSEAPLETLTSHLERRKVLLLLDNLEHVLPCAPELSRLLQACPGLTLLATSRELLRIQGERAYALPPLAEDEAVALFCERGRVDASDTTRELCARLEGLPLAIELAAARTRILSPGQLLERLSQRLDLLKGPRDADPRQQTLRATIEWSYDLLSAREQQLFARLSVFSGGCTLEAAEEVCAADLDTVESLLDKSLLRRTASESGLRFWMLETIREYAAELFCSRDDADEIRSRHARFLSVSLAEPGRLLDRATWVPRLEVERDNLRAALRWALANESAETRLTLASAYGWLCMARGPVEEGMSSLAAALGDGSEHDSSAYARALWGLGALAWRQGEYDLARRSHEASLAVARRVGDRQLAGRALRALGILAADELDVARSTALLNEALEVFRELGDRAEVDECLNMLGWGAIVRGDYSTARALIEEALASSRLSDDARGVMRCAGNLAFVASQEERFDDALALSREGLLIAHELADIGSIGGSLLELASIAAERGRLHRCAVMQGGAEALYEATESAFDSRELEQRERAMAILGQELAPDLVQDLLATGRAMGVDELVAYALEFVETESRQASSAR